MRHQSPIAALAFGVAATTAAYAQTPAAPEVAMPAQAATPAPLAAPIAPPMASQPFQRMIGCWDVTGTLQGNPVTNRAGGHWLLDGNFFLLRLESTTKGRIYQADVFYGWDASTKQIITHWIDTTGGAASRTLGLGSATPDGLEVLFNYPDGKLLNRITLDKGETTWRMLIRTAPDGPVFADYHFAPRACAPGELIEWPGPSGPDD